MLFSSLVFVCLFLPSVVVIHWCLPGIRHKNLWLLFTSLIFYYWGENYRVLILFLITFLSYCFGILLIKIKHQSIRKMLLVFSLIVISGFLFYFKYFEFTINNLNRIFFNWFVFADLKIVLPVGISFFTFQAVAYIVDIYKRKFTPSSDFLNFSLFISLFPQLVAGPIVLYDQVSSELKSRLFLVDNLILGFQRFVLGLGKKVLIANQTTLIADKVFALESASLFSAWLGIISYGITIYFDFSGYSDMAIGIGKMLGFNFPENFNFPYLSKSIKEFWRRWNITLSSWFKNYLYIPLGGNQVSTSRQIFNLLVVFLATGIWHGSGWNFILWGVVNGFFVIIENLFLINFFKNLPSIVSRLYFLVAVSVSWVFFRLENLDQILSFLKSMFLPESEFSNLKPLYTDDLKLPLIALGVGILLSTGVLIEFVERIKLLAVAIDLKTKEFYSFILIPAFKQVVLLFILFLSLLLLVGGSHNPFIYFRF